MIGTEQMDQIRHRERGCLYSSDDWNPSAGRHDVCYRGRALAVRPVGGCDEDHLEV